MKKIKATFEAPVVFSYELNLSEDDLLCPIDFFIKHMKSAEGMQEIAENMYMDYWHESDLLPMIKENIVLKTCEITDDA